MALPTKKIPALTAGIALTGFERLEAVQGGVSVQLEARDFVLPIDSLLTMSGMGGSIPGSRQLVSSVTIQVNDGGPGGQVSLTALSTAGSPTGVQTLIAALGNNNNVPLGPLPTLIGILDVDTTAGAADITGLVAQFDGQVVTISNTTAALLRLMANNVASAAANRFRLSANIGIVTNGSYSLRYSAALARWISLS